MREVQGLAVLLFCPSFFSLSSLWLAYHSFYSLKKSKTMLKKMGRNIKLWQKLILLYPIKANSPYYRKAKIVRNIYYLLLIVLLLCLAVLVLTGTFSMDSSILRYCVMFKVVALDLPIAIISLIMTKHGKNGGRVWKWED